jgi:hypothetical protein
MNSMNSNEESWSLQLPAVTQPRRWNNMSITDSQLARHPPVVLISSSSSS